MPCLHHLPEGNDVVGHLVHRPGAGVDLDGIWVLDHRGRLTGGVLIVARNQVLHAAASARSCDDGITRQPDLELGIWYLPGPCTSFDDAEGAFGDEAPRKIFNNPANLWNLRYVGDETADLRRVEDAGAVDPVDAAHTAFGELELVSPDGSTRQLRLCLQVSSSPAFIHELECESAVDLAGVEVVAAQLSTSCFAIRAGARSSSSVDDDDSLFCSRSHGFSLLDREM